MARPSRNVDALLLAAGRELYPASGAAGLTVRRVVDQAGVNLGMFHYHFGSKDAFVRALLQTLYDDMFARLELAVRANAPVEALSATLNVLGRFAADNAPLLRRLLADAMSGEVVAQQFLRDNLPRHLGVLRGLVVEGQRAGRLRPLPVPQALAFLAGAIAMPVILGAALVDRALVGPELAEGLRAQIATPEAIAMRVECALAGLAPAASAPRESVRRRA